MLLEDCGHIFEVTALDKFLGLNEEEEQTFTPSSVSLSSFSLQTCTVLYLVLQPTTTGLPAEMLL